MYVDSNRAATETLLNCLVHGGRDPIKHIFPVEIARIKTVGQLKDEIKAKLKPSLDHIPANDLLLWKVEIAADNVEHFEKDLSEYQFNSDDDLLPLEKLSDRFSSFRHPPEHPHPSASLSPAITDIRKQWCTSFPSKYSPLAGYPEVFAAYQYEDPPALCFNRPPEAASPIPTTLYHPVFGQFQDDCESYTPTRDDNTFALYFAYYMSAFYGVKDRREEQIWAAFSDYGLSFNGNKSSLDGYTAGGALLEIKDEIGSPGADPLLQGAWSYINSIRETLDNNFNLPCLIIYIFGGHIGFAGAVWTDTPHLQVLCPVLPLFYHRTDMEMRERAARCFGATKKANLTLQSLYDRELKNGTRDTAPQLMFPYPTEYVSLLDSTTRGFTYVSSLEKGKLVFRVKSGSDDICIKFVRQYSKEAHTTCASMGFAPTLRGFQYLPGGWYMVVMDFIDETYAELNGLDKSVKAGFEDEIRKNVELCIEKDMCMETFGKRTLW
ncbi:hypothetical protein EW145_g7609 [Phellinidium pouzarii]|uniref:Crinkler effector protein N-terminal domain-containing protein n=1 Tax=Phellinidium pouzarii TaxID=167371 RepID=A0A4S4KGT8_9AGAM|nr:hypothetical protein EW145_g7609 [Phellinidium pouzarii]